MSQRIHADWLQAFVEWASYGEAPLKTLFWTGISTIAGALRRRVWIDQKYFQWLPNFYVIIVAPPGIIAKSTTANIGMNLLREIPDVRFGPDVITWQALITALAKSTESVPDPRNLGEFYPMSCVTFCSDELGNLLNPHDRDLIDALVTLWDGKRGEFLKETKTSGSDRVENPWVNIIGCTTPAWISGNFPEYMIGGGFTSRCVFVYADKKRQLVPYPDAAVPQSFEDDRRKLIHDLEMISMLFGEFRLAASARKWGDDWYARHWADPPVNLTGDQFGGYLARKQTHLHKLAMILSAAEGDSLVITDQHLIKAEAFINVIEQDMPKVFSRIGQSVITRGTFEIIQLVESVPGITQTQLFGRLVRTLSYKDFGEALAGALNAKEVVSLQVGSEMKLFRPQHLKAQDG